jgi:NAD(P)-dependent dehydrogenase (short-subunit alcohol dehydrogenase family)
MNTLKSFELSGKTALVTGCNTGLGMAMAIALAEAGADIIGGSIAEDYSSITNAIETICMDFPAKATKWINEIYEDILTLILISQRYFRRKE